MFNTLGNLSANPSAGLLFVNWEQGWTLQLTGEARILWDPLRVAQFPGARRLVEFRMDRGIEIAGATGLRWRFLESSPFNPAR